MTWADLIAEVRRADDVERRERPRVHGKFHFFHNGIEHFCLWNQTLPNLDSDEWIEVVW